MKPIIITDATFKREVSESNTLTVADFWAEWCGPCRMIAPLLEEVAQEYADQVTVTKLNVDENPETSMAFGIRSIPTLLFFKGGNVVDKVIGLVSLKELKARIDRLVETTVTA